MRFKSCYLKYLLAGFLLGSTSVHATLKLPDPTKPGSFTPPLTGAAEMQEKQFKLQSVLISSQRRVAVINDRSVQVGDRINGATVQQIEKNRVVLDKRGRRFDLGLDEYDFKQRK